LSDIGYKKIEKQMRRIMSPRVLSIPIRPIPVTKTPPNTAPHIRASQRAASTMASSLKVHITPENTGLLHVPQTAEAADKATELLQKDLEVGLNEMKFMKSTRHCQPP